MKLCSKTMVILLVAAIESLWIQEVSAGLIPNLTPAGSLKNDDSLADFDSILRFYKTLNSTTNSKKTGANISWGSQDVQIGNVYSGNKGRKIRYGPRDIQIGNNFTKNSYGTNVYGPILVQKNNDYNDKGEKVQYGANVTQIGNVYPENPGNKDIYAPVVIQEDNIYPEKSGNKTVFGTTVNHINNTYPKSVEANKDAVKPIIPKRGNVHTPTSNTNSVVRDVVKENGHRFHPSQNHHEKLYGGMTIGMVKKQHENMKRIIVYHLRTDQPTSKRCYNGMMDSERLDKIERLDFEVETQVKQLEALQKINRNRKIICDTIANQCSKSDDMRKWIRRTTWIVIESSEESKELWQILRKC